MELKAVIILLIAINSVSSQSMLSCSYTMIDDVYGCIISIYNPHDLLDFDNVTGSHFPGFNDNSVKFVTTGFFASTRVIPPVICRQFENIRTLSYSRMGLGFIHNEAFEACKQVTSINVSENNITNVDPSPFRENVLLDNLSFKSNALQTIPESAFFNLTNLVHLNLEDNQIDDLPAGIFRLVGNLQELNLKNNKFVTLRPDWFRNLPNLNILRLGNNKIEEIPPNAFIFLNNLRQVWFDGNILEIIHASSFGRLSHLELMNFVNNHIIAMDSRILDQTNVSQMLMVGNICANRVFEDNTPGRPAMRDGLSQCFEMYLELNPACPADKLNERVCLLEDEYRELLFTTESLIRGNNELERKIEEQAKAFSAAIVDLQNQIDELNRSLATTTTTEDPKKLLKN